MAVKKVFYREPKNELPAGIAALLYTRVLSNSPVLVSCFLGYYVLLRSLRSESVPLIERAAYDGRDNTVFDESVPLPEKKAYAIIQALRRRAHG